MPPIEEIDVVARTTYSILVEDGKISSVDQAMYFQDLIDSMDILAVEVWNEIDFDFDSDGDTRRSLRSVASRRSSSSGTNLDSIAASKKILRRLEVRIQLPTFIDGVSDAGKSLD